MKKIKLYSKESLTNLQKKVNLADALNSIGIKLFTLGPDNVLFADCPFHKNDENEFPSFVVNQQYNRYHCFNCGVDGDAISFLMVYEKMTFQEAVEYLAKIFKVKLVK
jgi:DNA primase